ncbi:aldo/keto reductase [Rhizobium grahamii]|uniref:Uncharacterized protein n=1 Tax=Rhizobium grahamii TaxID=1120045 RepID=A0A370KED8_9HYPH|nr:aldo/keto reductase [Rhizobium grahamii]RDJ02002.1 hypothetical protein B5K06_33055 [Rhizobium grahamii]
MQYLALGPSGLASSGSGLETMSRGEQNTADEAHSRLHATPEARINFVDAVEMYPVPGRFFRYNEERAQDTALAHTALFRKHGVDSVHGSLAFVIGRPFVASPLIGATSLAQVKHNLPAADAKLSEELLVGMQDFIAGTDPCRHHLDATRATWTISFGLYGRRHFEETVQ